MGLVYLWSCVCVYLHVRVHYEALYLFENHDLIQEVNTLAGEEFPDGLLSFEALRVRGGTHLGRLVLQELCQRVVLHIDMQKNKLMN